MILRGAGCSLDKDDVFVMGSKLRKLNGLSVRSI
jgi:hypothetical protein